MAPRRLGGPPSETGAEATRGARESSSFSVRLLTTLPPQLKQNELNAVALPDWALSASPQPTPYGSSIPALVLFSKEIPAILIPYTSDLIKQARNVFKMCGFAHCSVINSSYGLMVSIVSTLSARLQMEAHLDRATTFHNRRSRIGSRAGICRERTQRSPRKRSSGTSSCSQLLRRSWLSHPQRVLQL